MTARWYKAHMQESIAAAARRASPVIAPILEARLGHVYGPDWLAVVNERRAATGMPTGRGLHDHRFCLAVLGYDPATDGWADEQWRAMARDLNRLANRAAHDDAVSVQEASRAVELAETFAQFFTQPEPLLPSVCPGQARNPNEHDRLVGLCRHHHEKSRWPEMLDIASRLQQLDPGCFCAASWTAMALTGMQRWRDALPALRVWVRNDPGNPIGWYEMWFAAMSCSQRQAELEATTGWVRAAYNDATAWGCHAMALEAAGRTSDAIAAARRAASLTPADAEMFSNFNNVMLTRASIGEVSETLDPLHELASRNNS